MSISAPNSVLILGAGVSAPFKLPLGDALPDLIAEQIGKESTRAQAGRRTQIDPGVVVEWTGRSKDWYANPIYGTLLREKMGDSKGLTLEQARSAHEELHQLRTLLSNQTAETIDAFIAENPTSAATAKLALGAIMLRHCYLLNGETGALRAKPFASRTTNSFCEPGEDAERNWTHLLINIVRHAIDNQELDNGRKIQVVTFNYDTILEHVLHRQFANREVALGDYKRYIDIHHAHGSFGSIDDECVDPARTAARWAKGIYVVKENGVSTEMVETRARIQKAISQAAHIYSIGFAFAGPNCRLLGLNLRPKNDARCLTYCNYDANRERRRVQNATSSAQAS